MKGQETCSTSPHNNSEYNFKQLICAICLIVFVEPVTEISRIQLGEE